IPAENLIAHFQGKGTKLLAEVGSADEARAFLETLEVGTDGVILRPRSPADVRDLAKVLAARNRLRLDLQPATVVEVKAVGSGDRVCVDTCSLLRVGEGMLVGSSAQGLFLVMSESMESEYVASRPFRVNAGPVHAYCLLPNGKTKYLSELEAGDEVLAVDEQGHTRPVVVGRVKIETRPLLRVVADCGGKRVVTLVQNAETIRLVAPPLEGAPRSVSVTALKPGDSVLVRLESGGRHFGMPIQETIVEK
ncbi:MAG TPA: 3-dehydroquinate synthase II, partial [Candidatus Thermoplasmatota archaeon]|nr:3-dehydroquinate synthase II [Candidatus Thermoplasmatota archaeon]